MSMDVKSIVAKYLNDNGYDGLVVADNGCGCQLSDLAPCDEFSMDCQAAYKWTYGDIWEMKTTKQKSCAVCESQGDHKEWCSAGHGPVKPKQVDKYFEFYNSVSCLFAEGVEFMTKGQIYDAIKKDWGKIRGEK